MRGYPDGTFGPQKILSRAESAQIIMLLMNRLNVFVDDNPDVN